MDRSGLFSFKGIKNRNVLKLAPDAFAIMNNSFGEKVISPMDANSTPFSAPGDRSKTVQMQGGITSINVNSAISPAGAGRASIEVLAPQYKGGHNDYYVDMPNGVRLPYFLPMTEVKIYMKSRFIEKTEEHRNKPQYYPVFWGFITSVNESYTNGVSTFSLSCVDLLNWWSFIKVTVKPSSENSLMGAPQANRFPTIFEFLNPWEVIYALFLDTFFVQGGQDNLGGLTSQFVAADYGGIKNTPQFGLDGNGERRAVLGGLASSTVSYWSNRFGFQNFVAYDENAATETAGEASAQNKGILEMYGLRGSINVNTIGKSVMDFKENNNRTKGRTVKADVNLDFSILERIQPFGQFSLYGDGSTTIRNTKMEIANKVCDDTHMEFFLDMNGSFVFKPPMYNLDVVNGKDGVYVMESEDIINSTFAHNIDGIVNFLEVTGPMNYNNPELLYKGLHIDYPSIRRYGMRHQILSMNYGNTPETLRAIAVAEMARINSKTKTGTMSIPLRSEMRLGYPVYISHIDAYYYVSGISHSFTFGSTATTQLSLESRRDRVYDDGSITGSPGKILKGYVSELRKGVDDILSTGGTPTSTDLNDAKQGARTPADINQDNEAETLNTLQKSYIKETKALFAGNNSQALTRIRKARTTLRPDVAIPPGKPEDRNTDANTSIQVNSNELIHITKETVPYTDAHGYEHIGAFPYGANLRLDRLNSSRLIDQSNRAESDVYKNEVINNIAPKNQ
jgi:hypothetical protein